MCSRLDDPTQHDKETPDMRYENLGPVANPDGSPTELTRAMLAGTGRDPVVFAAVAIEATPTCDLCGEQDAEGGEDWNGDTGQHRSCEAEQANGGEA